jgi:hypothetical protein
LDGVSRTVGPSRLTLSSLASGSELADPEEAEQSKNEELERSYVNDLRAEKGLPPLKKQKVAL